MTANEYGVSVGDGDPALEFHNGAISREPV